MSPALPTAGPVASAVSAAELLNEGLEPGVRVCLDGEGTATVRFVEMEQAYTHVRMEGTGLLLRVASWRLDRLLLDQ